MAYTRQRLPTLEELLASKTRSPVDLYGFYIYMRDHQKSVDYLDLWLDIKQHTSLCRLYVRELRRSVLVATPDTLKEIEQRNVPRESVYSDDVPRQQEHGDERSRYQSSGFDMPEYYSARQNEPGDRKISPFLRSQAWEDSPDIKFHQSREAHVKETAAHENRNSFPSSFSSSQTKTITRADLKAAAEKILLLYLTPGAEREVILPDHIVAPVQEAIDKQGRDDPEVFDLVREYIFLAMERDAFPGFLQQKALGNLVPVSALFRLVLGLFSLFAGLWCGLAMIFLAYSSQTRAWVALPFGIAIYCLIAWLYNLDPIMTLCGISESTFLSFRRIEERYVRKLLTTRSFVCLGLWLVIAGGLTCLFVFVPSYRLGS